MNRFQQARPPEHGLATPHQHILVVDDDTLVRQMSARMLVGFGYDVYTAEDGAAGWEALQGGNYDLLLTDHNMPNMSGIDLIKKVRIARMTLPAILISGALPEEELEQHPWFEFSAILSKPFSSQELLAALKEALIAPEVGHHRASFATAKPAAEGRQFMQSQRWGIHE